MPTRSERTITKIKLCGINALVEKKIKENKTTKIRFKVDLIARNCQYEVEVEDALTKVSWKPSTRPPVITINMAPRGKSAFIF